MANSDRAEPRPRVRLTAINCWYHAIVAVLCSFVSGAYILAPWFAHACWERLLKWCRSDGAISQSVSWKFKNEPELDKNQIHQLEQKLLHLHLLLGRQLNLDETLRRQWFSFFRILETRFLIVQPIRLKLQKYRVCLPAQDKNPYRQIRITNWTIVRDRPGSHDLSRSKILFLFEFTYCIHNLFS